MGYPCCVNRSLLAGPEGHPFHPLLVPLPLGAFVSSLIFDILTRTRANGLPYLVDGAFWLIGVGLTGALVAAVPGVLDLRAIPRGTPAFATACTHLTLNAATVVLFAIGYAWRAGDHVALDKTRWGPDRGERSRRGVPHRRHVAGQQADLPPRHARHRASRSPRAGHPAPVMPGHHHRLGR